MITRHTVAANGIRLAYEPSGPGRRPGGPAVHATAPRAFTAALTEFPTDLPDAETARRWPAEDGITQVGEEAWYDAGPPAATPARAGVAEGPGSTAFADGLPDAAGRLRVALA
ncbi:hypothetical protein ACFXA3_28885 [Streptomyces sp. NPDC059456]|uniref:hypothetical protein n=1 Tax=Streptomyces sp. NPDC059456 TaxID=3346838 RepID=UPI00367851AF